MGKKETNVVEINYAKLEFLRVNIDDIKTLIEYRINFLKELYSLEEKETDGLKETLRQYFVKKLSSNEYIGWLAEYKGRILGTGGMVIWQMPGRYGFEKGRLGYICNMYTIPEARNHGISTHLLAELIKEGKTLGLGYLHLRAHKDAISIYKKAGFTEPHCTELQMKLF